MKLQDWLNEKSWNTAILSRRTGINLTSLRKIINGNGGINLDTALIIEKFTQGEVKAWDLSVNGDDIKKGRWALKKTKKNKQQGKEYHKTNDKYEITPENI